MSQKAELNPLALNPDDGRVYPMGRMSAVFKADLEETNSTLSVSEWWLEPNMEGLHIHERPETHLFWYVCKIRWAPHADGGKLKVIALSAGKRDDDVDKDMLDRFSGKNV